MQSGARKVGLSSVVNKQTIVTMKIKLSFLIVIFLLQFKCVLICCININEVNLKSYKVESL